MFDLLSRFTFGLLFFTYFEFLEALGLLAGLLIHKHGAWNRPLVLAVEGSQGPPLQNGGGPLESVSRTLSLLRSKFLPPDLLFRKFRTVVGTMHWHNLWRARQPFPKRRLNGPKHVEKQEPVFALFHPRLWLLPWNKQLVFACLKSVWYVSLSTCESVHLLMPICRHSMICLFIHSGYWLHTRRRSYEGVLSTLSPIANRRKRTQPNGDKCEHKLEASSRCISQPRQTQTRGLDPRCLTNVVDHARILRSLAICS